MSGEAPVAKRTKILPFESLYLERIPASPRYNRSYMHRDNVTHTIVVGTSLITASHDGYIKFWRRVSKEPGVATSLVKLEMVVEFLKTYRAHSAPIVALVASGDGKLVASLSSDKTVKIFDLTSCDMLVAKKLEFVPDCACWIQREAELDFSLLVTEKNTANLYLFKSVEAESIVPLDALHFEAPIQNMTFSSLYCCVVAVDTDGRLYMWNPHSPELPPFEYLATRASTHLDDLQKSSAVALSITLSHRQDFLSIYGSDHHVRIFRLSTGRLYRKYDESLAVYKRLFVAGKLAKDMDKDEFENRCRVEDELSRVARNEQCCIFDESDNFLLYSTLVGIKVLNIVTNRVVRIIGLDESLRFVNLSLCTAPSARSQVSLDLAASNNPAMLVEDAENDIFLAATAFQQNRFYLFTKGIVDRPVDDRDVLNERVQAEITEAKAAKPKRLPTGAILRTTLGDIHVELYADKAPKAVENFAGHARSGYYDNLIFHRVIRGFMLQTGDPLGDGTGGSSIWGSDFEDEFHPSLRHDRPFTLSMANAGRNTNGSQFFITTVACPWLDDKHTVFGRVIRGSEVVKVVENVQTDSLDKPINDVKIVQIDLVK